jgi:translation initiation factor 4G
MPPQAPLTPGQPGHLRRESAQSTHSDMSNPNIGPGRGGYQQGRGRGGYGGQYGGHQQMPYSPGPQYRGAPQQPRGGMNPQFQGQGRGGMGFPNSPHQQARSPALTHSVPGTPQMQQVPMAGQHIPGTQFQGYPQHMGHPQVSSFASYSQVLHHHQTCSDFSSHKLTLVSSQQYMPPFDPQQGYYGGPPPQGYYMPQAGMQQYGMAPPSPRPGFQQYVPGQYNQPQPMSRTSSAVSEHQRPNSSVSQPAAPSTTPSNGASSPAPSSNNFTRPPRKSAAIVIKDPNSGSVKTFDKPEVSPAPVSRSPAIVSSTPTPPPASRSTEPQHARSDSKVTKNPEEVRQSLKDQVAAQMAAAASEEKEAVARKDKEKADLAELAKKEAEEKAAKAKAADQALKDAEAEAEKAEEARVEKLAQERAKKEAEEKAKAEAEEQAKLRAEETAAKEKSEAETRAAAEKAKAAPTEQAATEETSTNTEENETPSTTGGATTSDDSMGPPSKKGDSNKRPSALNLSVKTNNVEPPQPTPAMLALRSARMIDNIQGIKYPEAINSPNPSLNASAPMGKFKYDKEFLMQFQSVFTEKPSVDWDAKIKETVGDEPGSARPGGSGRTPSTMGPRQTSGRAGLSGAFAMGSMGAFGAGSSKPLPPNTTSEQRYQMSLSGQRAPAVNPLASRFSGTGGTFPQGAGMSRGNSSTNLSMSGNPQSPRVGSNTGGRSGRQNSRQSQPPKKTEAQEAKMPLTAGIEVKPLPLSTNGWKPRSLVGAGPATGAAGPAPGAGAGGSLDPEAVQRKVKSALNKMTPEKFDRISDQILEIAGQSKDENDGRTLRQVIQLTFEKACDEAHWASMYAKFCKRMLESMDPSIKDESITDKNGNVVMGGNLFRKYLLNRCQEEFERGWQLDIGEKPEGEPQTEEAAMLSDEYYVAATAKRRGLGLVQFIGELYKLGMLTERIMHACVKKLVDIEGIPQEAEIESLVKLLKTVGGNLDSTEKGHPMMDAYFLRIDKMSKIEELNSRMKFMLMVSRG